MTFDNTLSIRKATTADASEISNLIISSLRQTNTQDYSPDIIDRVVNNFTPEKVTELIKSRQVFIASQHNHIIGTVSLDSTVNFRESCNEYKKSDERYSAKVSIAFLL